MKILHLIDSGGLFGAEQMLLNLACAQRADGHSVHIISGGTNDDGEKAVEIAARKRGLEVTQWRSSLAESRTATLRLHEWAKKDAFDIWHSHGYKFNVLSLVIPRKKRRAKFVSTLHGYVRSSPPSRMWAYEKLDRISLRRMDAVVAVDRALRNEISRVLPDNSFATYIPNGIPVGNKQYTKLADNALPTPEFFADHEINIVCIGRLAPEKRFADVLQAISLLNSRRINTSLTIIGEGRLDERLQSLAARLKSRNMSGLPATLRTRINTYQCSIVWPFHHRPKVGQWYCSRPCWPECR